MHNLIYNRFDSSRNYSFAARSKNCSERVETLQKEFKGLKKDIESTCKEMDATRSIKYEIVAKSLGNNQK